MLEAESGAAPEPVAPPLLFDAVLHPHRSLSQLGFVILMLVLCLVSFTAGIVFLLQGAWPVLGFFGLDVLAVYVAFKLNYRSARQFESVQLDGDALRVRHVRPSGKEREWTFAPNWLQVRMDDPPRHASQLVLSSHGQSVVIGAFLTPTERLEVAVALREALARWREPQQA